MSTETTSKEIQKIFNELEMSVTSDELNKAVEIVTYYKLNGFNAYTTATVVIQDLELGMFYTPFQEALISHGLFKN